MLNIPRLNQFNGMVGALKKEAQRMREILNEQQDIHERKLRKNKQYRIGKQSRQFEKQLQELNSLVEAIERLRPVGGKWDIKFGELIIYMPEHINDEKDILQAQE